MGNKAMLLIYVGTLSQLYKAPDILIKAPSLCIDRGADVRLSVLGDGKENRKAFYLYVRKKTEEWRKEKGCSKNDC